MALYGASIPLTIKPGDDAVVVTVICPNAYSHTRLMQALQSIVPEAADGHAPSIPPDSARGYNPPESEYPAAGANGWATGYKMSPVGCAVDTSGPPSIASDAEGNTAAPPSEAEVAAAELAAWEAAQDEEPPLRANPVSQDEGGE